MTELDYRAARLRRTLLIIILATLPCYLLGMIILWVGNSVKGIQTPTPSVRTVIVTATNNPTNTLEPPTRYPTHTETFAPTMTTTPTDTPTATPTATVTITPSPTDTATETPTATETETPIPPTETAIPATP